MARVGTNNARRQMPDEDFYAVKEVVSGQEMDERENRSEKIRSSAKKYVLSVAEHTLNYYNTWC